MLIGILDSHVETGPINIKLKVGTSPRVKVKFKGKHQALRFIDALYGGLQDDVEMDIEVTKVEKPARSF